MNPKQTYPISKQNLKRQSRQPVMGVNNKEALVATQRML